MKSFKDLGIRSEQQGFTGDKIKISKILNREIVVEAHKVTNSKFDGSCLHLQIKIGETKHVVFTGSAHLMAMIAQVPKDAFPFKTTIVEENERYEFT